MMIKKYLLVCKGGTMAKTEIEKEIAALMRSMDRQVITEWFMYNYWQFKIKEDLDVLAKKRPEGKRISFDFLQTDNQNGGKDIVLQVTRGNFYRKLMAYEFKD